MPTFDDVNNLYVTSDIATAVYMGDVQVYPPTIPETLWLWWANDLALSDGDPVTSWVDNVSGAVLEQSDTIRQPFFDIDGANGNPCVTFAGSTNADWLGGSHRLSSGLSGHVIAVVYLNTYAGVYVLTQGNNATPSGWVNCMTGLGTIRMRSKERYSDPETDFRSDLDDPSSLATPFQDLCILEWNSDGDTYEFRVNNSIQPLETTPTQTGPNNGTWFGDLKTYSNTFSVGAFRTTNGTFIGADFRLAYLLVANGVMSPVDRTNLYNWLSTEYAITI